MTFFPIFMIAWKKLPMNGCSFIIEFAFLCWFSLYRTNYVDQPKCMQKKSWKWQSIFRLLLSVNFESFVNDLAYKLKNTQCFLELKTLRQSEIFTDSKYSWVIGVIWKGHVCVSFWNSQFHPLLSLKIFMGHFIMIFWIY